ncbi:MAG: FAD-dependent oxidoreductase [Lautropia sp.]|nr:FAD-dependent oxidoreductase [Lautropia sp.]
MTIDATKGPAMKPGDPLLPVPALEPGELPWRKYLCRACGLIYDEAEGDPDGGLPPGTRFEDIPEDWICPLCGVSKADFELLETVGQPFGAEGECSQNAVPAVPAQPLAVLGAGRREGARHAGVNGGRPAGGDDGVVIIGAGHAGWQMVRALRERDAGLPITLVSADAADVYDKPMLSVAFSRQLTPEALIRETGVAAARRLGIRLLADTHAFDAVPQARRVRTTRGTFRYRHLVLAHGARSRLHPALPPAWCWRIDDLSSYRRFREALTQRCRIDIEADADVMIIGAGLVGSELANDLALGDYSVLLVERGDQPVPQAARADADALLAAWRALPIRFVGDAQPTGIERTEGGLYRVHLVDGRSYRVREVISALGVTPPSRLAERLGLAWQDGIVVDPQDLSTDRPEVHALGDCISVGGKPSRFIAPIARQAALIADKIVSGDFAPYQMDAGIVRVKTSSYAFNL